MSGKGLGWGGGGGGGVLAQPLLFCLFFILSWVVSGVVYGRISYVSVRGGNIIRGRGCKNFAKIRRRCEVLVVHFLARRVSGVRLDELLSVVVEEKVPAKKCKNGEKKIAKGAYPRSRVVVVWPLARRTETEPFYLVVGEIGAAKNAKTESNSPGGWFTRFCCLAATTFCRGPPSI